MATQFAISDRWFSPVMTNTPANRMYAMAATSQGVIDKPATLLTADTIFDKLEAAGISWKNYVPNYPNGSSLKAFPAFAKYMNTNIAPMQSLYPDQFDALMSQVRQIAAVVGRTVPAIGGDARVPASGASNGLRVGQ